MSDKAQSVKITKGNTAMLAVHGGPKVRTAPFPSRHLLGKEEKKAVVALFDRAIESGNAFGYGGPDEEAYCKHFAGFMGGGFADGVNSGTTAVYVALRALNPEPFTEIIVGPITDPGGIMPVPLLNCIPMVPDAASGSFNPGPEQIEALISSRTSAIVVAHIFGEPADMKGIMAVASKYKIPVVEDCAQAHGATIDGQLVGTFGALAAFSTMFGKHHCTGGQGGVVFTRDEKLYGACRRASDRGKPFGLPPGSGNDVATLNFNLNDLAGVIGSVQLKKLPGIIRRRRAAAARILKGIEGLAAVSAPAYVAGAEPSFWYLRFKFNAEAMTCRKSDFCAALRAEGIPVRERYVNPAHMNTWFEKKRVFGTSDLPWCSPSYKGDPNRRFECPNAMAALEAHFDLPILESWGTAETAAVVKALKKISVVYRK